MLYKKTEIYEDKDILDIIKMAEISRRTGITQAYLSLLKDKKRIASEKVYNKIRKAVYGSNIPTKID